MGESHAYTNQMGQSYAYSTQMDQSHAYTTQIGQSNGRKYVKSEQYTILKITQIWRCF